MDKSSRASKYLKVMEIAFQNVHETAVPKISSGNKLINSVNDFPFHSPFATILTLTLYGRQLPAFPVILEVIGL
jgi:hypothetical protein